MEAGVIVDVKEGPADMVILDTIEEHPIDLLIMGTIGRRGMAGMLIGNTAEKLLPVLPCAILADQTPRLRLPGRLEGRS